MDCQNESKKSNIDIICCQKGGTNNVTESIAVLCVNKQHKNLLFVKSDTLTQNQIALVSILKLLQYFTDNIDSFTLISQCPLGFKSKNPVNSAYTKPILEYIKKAIFNEQHNVEVCGKIRSMYQNYIDGLGLGFHLKTMDEMKNYVPGYIPNYFSPPIYLSSEKIEDPAKVKRQQCTGAISCDEMLPLNTKLEITVAPAKKENNHTSFGCEKVYNIDDRHLQIVIESYKKFDEERKEMLYLYAKSLTRGSDVISNYSSK